MSAIVETPNTTSFYIPIEDDDSTVFSNHAAGNLNEMNIYSKKRFSEGYRSFLKTSRFGNHSTFEYFTTKNISGYAIRNARTGYLYPQYRVGRHHEYLFFKVRLSNRDSYQAQNTFHKFPTTGGKDKAESDVLFYDSPEEYENHQRLEVPLEMKQQWRARYEKLIRFMEKNARASETNSRTTKHETPPPGLSLPMENPPRPSSPNYPPPPLV